MKWTMHLEKEPSAESKKEMEAGRKQATEMSEAIVEFLSKSEKFEKAPATVFTMAVAALTASAIRSITQEHVRRGAVASLIAVLVEAGDPIDMEGVNEDNKLIASLANTMRVCGYLYSDAVKVQAAVSYLSAMVACGAEGDQEMIEGRLKALGDALGTMTATMVKQGADRANETANETTKH